MLGTQPTVVILKVGCCLLFCCVNLFVKSIEVCGRSF